jgi:hypothetical protein
LVAALASEGPPRYRRRCAGSSFRSTPACSPPGALSPRLRPSCESSALRGGMRALSDSGTPTSAQKKLPASSTSDSSHLVVSVRGVALVDDLSGGQRVSHRCAVPGSQRRRLASTIWWPG